MINRYDLDNLAMRAYMKGYNAAHAEWANDRARTHNAGAAKELARKHAAEYEAARRMWEQKVDELIAKLMEQNDGDTPH